MANIQVYANLTPQKGGDHAEVGVGRTIPAKTIQPTIDERHFPERTVQEWHTHR